MTKCLLLEYLNFLLIISAVAASELIPITISYVAGLELQQESSSIYAECQVTTDGHSY